MWGFPRGGHPCPGASTGGPLQLVARFLCIGRQELDTLPPPCRSLDGRPAGAYQTTLCLSSSWPRLRPTPRLWKRPCPLGRPLPEARRRTKPWPGATTTQCCLVSSGRPSVGQPTGRGEGVSSQTTNAQKPEDRLQRSSGRITHTCGSPHVKKTRVQPSRSMRKYPRWYPSTSRRMTSRGLHQISPAQQVRWELR